MEELTSAEGPEDATMGVPILMLKEVNMTIHVDLAVMHALFL